MQDIIKTGWAINHQTMYLYQKTGEYFAQVADDIKDIAEQELKTLGAGQTRPVYRGIHFRAKPSALYAIHLHTRLLNRILAPLISFGCHSDKVLYKKAMEIHWEDFLDPSRTFAVFASVSHSAIKHSKFAALRLKDAIADYFISHRGARPSVDTRDPDVWLNLHIENNRAIISLDTSGGALHKRGYRRKSVEAPMIETLAAAIIQLTEWDEKQRLVDPFCGSGTLLCEAYLKATHTPAAILRPKFGFEHLPDFDAALWKEVRQKGESSVRSIPVNLISGSDISIKAVKTALHNCSAIDKDQVIRIRQQNIFQADAMEDRVIVSNPPYGIRIRSEKDLGLFYKKVGDFLKQRCRGSTAYLYFGDRQYIGHLGLKPAWKKPLSSGGLDGRLVKVEIY